MDCSGEAMITPRILGIDPGLRVTGFGDFVVRLGIEGTSLKRGSDFLQLVAHLRGGVALKTMEHSEGFFELEEPVFLIGGEFLREWNLAESLDFALDVVREFTGGIVLGMRSIAVSQSTLAPLLSRSVMEKSFNTGRSGHFTSARLHWPRREDHSSKYSIAEGH